MEAAVYDPYETLGVPRTAGAAEIRRAYRKLAKRHHPDLNPGDRFAEERFKLVAAANALLCDPARRAQFDRESAGPTPAPFFTDPSFTDPSFAEPYAPRYDRTADWMRPDLHRAAVPDGIGGGLGILVLMAGIALSAAVFVIGYLLATVANNRLAATGFAPIAGGGVWVRFVPRHALAFATSIDPLRHGAVAAALLVVATLAWAAILLGRARAMTGPVLLLGAVGLACPVLVLLLLWPTPPRGFTIDLDRQVIASGIGGVGGVGGGAMLPLVTLKTIAVEYYPKPASECTGLFDCLGSLTGSGLYALDDAGNRLDLAGYANDRDTQIVQNAAARFLDSGGAFQ